MTTSHGMLAVVIHANQSEFKTEFKGTSCIKLSLMQSLSSPVPCSLLNVIYPLGLSVPLWWQLSDSVLYPSFMPLSATKAWLSEGTNHALHGVHRNEKEKQCLIYTSPISRFFLFNRPTGFCEGPWLFCPLSQLLSTWLFKNCCNIAISVIDFYEANTVSLHPSRPPLSKHFLCVSVLTQSLWAALERGPHTSSCRRVLLYSRWCLSKIEDPWSFANGDVDLEGERYAMILAV